MINLFPPEILLKIFSYLEYKDLVRCSQTCCWINGISSNDHLWKPLCEKHWLLKSCKEGETWKTSFSLMYKDWGQYIHCYSSLKSAWETISNFMSAHCPQIHRSINAGISEDELDEAEAKLTMKLPADLRCSLRIHNGQRLSTFGLLGCVVIQDHFRCESLLDIQTVASFQSLVSGCIPLTLCVDSGVTQFMALSDMDGQMEVGSIFYTCGVQDHTQLHKETGIFISGLSFRDWLCKYAKQLESDFLLDGHVFRFQNACEHDLMTGFITVSVCTSFLPEFSSIYVPKFFHVYRITLKMSESAPSSAACRLESRHWIITDENGVEEMVSGPGVVGEFPTMRPGFSFSWISCTTFKTARGNMRGHFTMRNLKSGEKLEVQCPIFHMKCLPYLELTIPEGNSSDEDEGED